MASGDNTREQVKRFLDLLVEHFGLQGLERLALALGLDDGSLPPGGVRRAAVGLLEYMRLRNRLPELVEACEARRSDVDWPQLR